MTMRLIARSLKDGNASVAEVELDYGIKTTFMVGRDSIPGVKLEIGKPIFETKEVETRMRVPLDRWVFLHSVTAKGETGREGSRVVAIVRIEEKAP